MRGLLDDAVARHLEVARALGSAILPVVIDAPGFEPPPDEVVAALRRLAPALERAGITLAIENHDRFPVERAGRDGPRGRNPAGRRSAWTP